MSRPRGPCGPTGRASHTRPPGRRLPRLCPGAHRDRGTGSGGRRVQPWSVRQRCRVCPGRPSWTPSPQCRRQPIDVVAPHNYRHVLGTMRNATEQDVADAIGAAAAAAPLWRALSFDDRAAILLRAADLLAGPWRAVINAATITGQSKSVYQAEIDAACELIDFWRFNVHFARRLLAEQPLSAPGTWNRMEYRPLEGFVLAITPFNFTSIAA